MSSVKHPEQVTERDPLLGQDANTVHQDTDCEDATDKTNTTELQGVKLYLALIPPLVGLFFVALDVTVVSTVAASIAADFDSLALVSWLGSTYLLAVATVQPISGKLTDRMGRRSGLFCALFVFGLGNLLCGLAPDRQTLIAGRVIAGLGGGGISAVGTFTINDLTTLRKRTVWQGFQNMCWAAGMGLGGVVGGVVNDTVGWRWIFLAVVPCIALIGVCGYFTLIRGLPKKSENADAKPAKGVDVVGSFFLTATLACFVLGLNFQEKGENALLSLILLIISGVCFVSFLVAEIWFVSDPVIPLHLLGNRSVSAVCFEGLAISLSVQGMLFYVPVLVQTRGYSAGQTGAQLLGNSLASAIAPMCIAIAMRVTGGYAVVKPIVFLTYLVAPVGFYFSPLQAPPWTTVVLMSFLGAGFCSVLTFNMTGLLANVDDKFQATATSMQYAFRQTGASAGLAISGIIFRVRVEKELANTSSVLLKVFGTPGGLENISKECSREHYIGDEPPRRCLIYFEALHDVFLFTLITAIVGCAFGMMIRNRSLDREKQKLDDNDSESDNRSS